MRILILGVSGLIGHKLLKNLSTPFEVFGTLHKSKIQYGALPLFSSDNIIANIDVSQFEILKGVFYTIKPDVILNCVGITKRKINPDNQLETLIINSVFPHQLAKWAQENNTRIIHFSTDCVFNGKTGNYNEESYTTAEDFYGQTKALGEINYNHSLTIRSSFVGQELFDRTELLDWLLSQNGRKITGYKNTLYSGVSTNFIVKVITDIILHFPQLSGLYQLATEQPISKFDLLCIAIKEFNLNIEIMPDLKHFHTPTLDGKLLKEKMNLEIPSWDQMMKELAADRNFYLEL